MVKSDRKGIILSVNEMAGSLLQLSGRTGQPFGGKLHLGEWVAPGQPDLFEDLLLEAADKGASLAQDVACVDTAGRGFRVDLLVAREPACDAEPETFVFFLAERLRTPPPNSQANGLLRHFYDLHVMGMAILDPVAYRWRAVNDRLCEILGYEREALLDQPWEAVSDPSDPDFDQQAFHELCSGGAEAYVGEKRFLHQDGHVVYAGMHVRAVRDASGVLQGCLVTLRDLTEVQKVTREARRQQHLQNLISRVNQAIVRTRGLKPLLQEVCRISVTEGRFSACWIGVWELSDTRNLRVFARAGEDVGDIDPLHSSREWQQGLEADDGGRLVLNELHPDEGLPGSRSAARAGRRALVRFALGGRGAVSGTVNLFSDEPGFFSPSVMSFLAEMVEDLSVALDRLTALEALELANKLVESSPVVLCRWSPQPGWPVEYLSSNVARWGLPTAELVSGELPFLDLVHPDDRDRVEAEVVEHVRQRRPRYRQEYRVITVTGDVIWIEEFTRAEYSEAGEPLVFEGVLTDITPRKQQEQREASRSHVLSLLAQGAQLQIILEVLAQEVELECPDMRCSIMLADESGGTLLVGAAPSLPTFFNRAVNGTPIQENVGSCGHAAATGKVVIADDIQTDPRWAPGRAIAREAGLASCWSAPILSTRGQVLGTFAIYHEHIHSPSERDIHLIQEKANLAAIAIERTRDAAALKESAERWRFALEGSGDGVWDWNLESNEVILSHRCMNIVGIDDKHSAPRYEQWLARVHPDDLDHLNEHLWSHLDGRLPNFACEHRVRSEREQWRWVLSRGLVVRRDLRGKPLRMVGTVTDISERKRMEQELREMATTDYLTGLANRRHFLSRVTEEIARLERGSHQAVVMILDLDYFKAVNDNYGHSAGDAVLRHFAHLMRDCLRKTDIPGRVGGEEFSVLLPDTETEAALHLAERLRARVEQVPVKVGAQSIPITVSIGLTPLCTTDMSPDDALQRADTALYQAKSTGRNRVEFLAAPDS
ncbi:diguanylate cyclase [Ectothiorhodospira marina]|uniref:PAS domain S-box-containing protein/diguanylate cyclase (GGDEF) domain-containing protein n=1 Tax=Ectothiorhodospira marina TaxID=1396821 RepID=A0A1H7FIY6_9GAMM|nr:diguanylate cyclase [Ectothiorhodospira marina]SEK24412.1 PAS domain S-box-containing protein/diguanylate cyclase (GGDEF) domain-containing protein [Ectothiorhodospira marina]